MPACVTIDPVLPYVPSGGFLIAREIPCDRGGRISPGWYRLATLQDVRILRVSGCRDVDPP